MNQTTRSLLCILSLATLEAQASTWLEPFDADVIAKADTFVVGKLDDQDATRLRVERVLAGADPGKEVVVAAFGEDQQAGARVYAWLDREKDGKWTVPTPTAAVDSFYDDNLVLGSFRISCAGGLYQPDFYERAHTAWFALLHGDNSTRGDLESLVREELARAPEYFGGEGDPADAIAFFRQQAALEILASDAALGPAVDLKPFLAAKDFHAQISAVRALAARDDSTNALIEVLGDKRTQEVPAMVTARLLRGRELDAAQRKELKKLARSASEENVWLCGGSIMDPRIIPDYSDVSIRQAIKDLL